MPTRKTSHVIPGVESKEERLIQTTSNIQLKESHHAVLIIKVGKKKTQTHSYLEDKYNRKIRTRATLPNRKDLPYA